ncbi:DJ-1/PfpI family protein [Thermohalobacter berrensis]|uniref:Intracellular protease/amidase n=1 Tax=Thermohalobacter berrensis TaxID=99594 RepID=A0A419SWA7_9FIRM|nr:DJ-1/PfpI family protein [Thermohalobacter berrensis]RKD29485.1 intracellular protease/amidase [Thermohalobacter berrensis]
MKICIFYYDGFCEFEVVLSALIFRDNHFTVALENRVYISEEKQKYLPDKTIDELNPDEIDLFIIPGGNPKYLYTNLKLKNFINELNKRNKFVAGICAGTYLMARYGLLKGKRCTGDSSGLQENKEYIDLFKDAVITKEDVVVDGNIVTSTGQAFIEFTFELCKLMGIYENNDEALMDYRWFKNIKQ